MSNENESEKFRVIEREKKAGLSDYNLFICLEYERESNKDEMVEVNMVPL